MTMQNDAVMLALEGERIGDFEFEHVIVDLALLRDDDFALLAAQRPALRSDRTVAHLLRHAHGLLSSAPHQALILTELAIRVAGALRDDEGEASEILHTRADAWQHRAAALAECGEYSEAMGAVESADALYAASGVMRAHGRPCLDLLRARLLEETGEAEEALEIADRAAQAFLTQFNDRKRYVIARVFCANILLASDRYVDALDAFDAAAEIAKELEDTETLAHIVASVGNTMQRIGDDERAREAFSMAIEMFETLRMPVEIARLRIRIGLGMLSRGDFDEGVAELGRSRAQFLDLGMPVVAAQACLEMVNGLLLANRPRWVLQLCNEMIATFSKANLHREAQKALGYIQELAAGGALTDDAIVYAKQFLHQLEHNPLLRFKEPDA